MRKLLILLFVVVIAALFLFNKLNSNPGLMSKDGLIFEVEQGTTAGLIARDLQREGAIRSADFFKIYSRIMALGGSYKAGSYMIPSGLSTMQTARLLVEGKTILFPFTVPEGRTLSQTAALVEQSGLGSAEAFIQAASDPALLNEFNITGPNAQGFLFPDTYMVPKPISEKALVRLMINTFYQQLAVIYPSYKELSKKEFNEKISMAGLVEKEYRVAEEAPMMASVFYNRLKQGVKLESCASVVYVLTEELHRPHPNRIFFVDLEVESPYNVYKNYGLPPAPISNPGAVALKAAFYPYESDYMFFVVKDPAVGSHQFSKTLSDHEKGREAYISSFFNKQ